MAANLPQILVLGRAPATHLGAARRAGPGPIRRAGTDDGACHRCPANGLAAV